VKLEELLGLVCGALLCPPQHQPGGPAGCEGLARGLRDDGKRLAEALAARGGCPGSGGYG
jgi:hypothetical protein